MLTRLKKELLLFGYVRKEYKDITKIPDDIMSLFIDWFNDAFYIKISGDLMEEFRETAASKSQMKDKYIIPIHPDISLECTIFPNAFRHNPKVQLVFEAETEREDISNFKIYLETQVEEIPTSMFKEIKEVKYRRGTAHFSTVKQNIVLHSKCVDHDELTICITAELLKLTKSVKKRDRQLKEKEETEYFVSPIWNKIIEYEWIIQDDMIEKYKSYGNAEWLFSQSFSDNSISLHMTPKGTHFDEESSNLGIQFYRLPKGVEAISAVIELSTNIEIGDGKLFAITQRKRNFEWGAWSQANGLDVEMVDAQIAKSGKLVFKYKVIIKKIYIDIKKERAVDETEWKNYGILD